MRATATTGRPELGGTGERDPVHHEVPPEKLNRHQAAQPDAESTASVAQALRTRRAASHRCAPLVCGRRDPLDLFERDGPSTFGLSADELRLEYDRLAALGWQLAEVTMRLAVAPRREVAT